MVEELSLFIAEGPCHFAYTTFSASSTSLTVYFLQSCDCNCYVSREILAPPWFWLQKYWHLRGADCRNTLTYAHTTRSTLPTYETSLDSLNLHAPEAGDFLEVILLYVSVKVK